MYSYQRMVDLICLKKSFNFFFFFMLIMFDFNPKIYSVKFFHKNKNIIHKNKNDIHKNNNKFTKNNNKIHKNNNNFTKVGPWVKNLDRPLNIVSCDISVSMNNLMLTNRTKLLPMIYSQAGIRFYILMGEQRTVIFQLSLQFQTYYASFKQGM